MAGRGRGREPVEEEVAEEEDEEDGEADSKEYVSFLDDPPTLKEQRLLTRRMFPSKVGGKPAWLIPQNLPSTESELACHCCSRPLRFLLQVYASLDWEKESAFHRVLHVFICTNCQPNQVRIFRAQLPRDNPFYSLDRPVGEQIAASVREAGDRDQELDVLCCHSCGLPRFSSRKDEDQDQVDRCSECERFERLGESPAMFQERELSTTQAELPDEEDEEDEAGGVDARKAASSSAHEDDEENEEVEEVYTPGAKKKDRDLVAEADAVIASAKAKGASEAVLEKLQAYRSKVADDSENALDASEAAVFDEFCKERGEYDPVFSKFNAYSKANMGHVLRYKFGGQPLWFAEPNRLGSGPPPCERCGGERVFEMQLQPQMIAILGGTRLAERLDFGTICCYSCRASCDPAKGSSPYLEEFAHVQAEPHDAWLPKG